MKQPLIENIEVSKVFNFNLLPSIKIDFFTNGKEKFSFSAFDYSDYSLYNRNLLLDKDITLFNGFGVNHNIKFINEKIKNNLLQFPLNNQTSFDDKLKKLLNRYLYFNVSFALSLGYFKASFLSNNKDVELLSSSNIILPSIYIKNTLSKFNDLEISLYLKKENKEEFSEIIYNFFEDLKQKLNFKNVDYYDSIEGIIYIKEIELEDILNILLDIQSNQPIISFGLNPHLEKKMTLNCKYFEDKINKVNFLNHNLIEFYTRLYKKYHFIVFIDPFSLLDLESKNYINNKFYEMKLVYSYNPSFNCDKNNLSLFNILDFKTLTDLKNSINNNPLVVFEDKNINKNENIFSLLLFALEINYVYFKGRTSSNFNDFINYIKIK